MPVDLLKKYGLTPEGTDTRVDLFKKFGIVTRKDMTEKTILPQMVRTKHAYRAKGGNTIYGVYEDPRGRYFIYDGNQFVNIPEQKNWLKRHLITGEIKDAPEGTFVDYIEERNRRDAGTISVGEDDPIVINTDRELGGKNIVEGFMRGESSLRDQASYPMTTEGKVKFLNNHFRKSGMNYEAKVEQGTDRIIIFDYDNREAFYFDSDDFTLADVSDQKGNATELVMSVGPGGWIKQGVQAGISYYVRAQTDEGMTQKEKLKGAAGAAAIGAGADLLIRGGVYVFRSRNASSRIARKIGDVKGDEWAQRTAEIESEMGLALPPSAYDKSQRIGKMEHRLRTHDKARRIFEDAEDKAFHQAINDYETAFDRYLTSGSNAELGKSARQSYDNLYNKMIDNRAKNARDNFALLDDTGTVPGELSNTLSEMDQIISELDSIAEHSPAARRMRDQLVKAREDLASGEMTWAKYQQLLETYGRASRGKQSLYSETDNKKLDQSIAKRIFGALENDLDDMAANAGNDPNGDILRNARDVYRSDSEAVEYLQQSAIGDLMNIKATKGGLSDEQIGQRLMRQRPQDAKQTIKILETVDSDFRNRFLARKFREAEEKAGVYVQGAGGDRFAGFNKKRFIDELKRADKGGSSVWDLLDPVERHELGLVLDTMERLQYLEDMHGAAGSPQLGGRVGVPTTRVELSNEAVELLIRIFSDEEKAATFIMDRRKRDALVDIINARDKKTERALKAMAYLEYELNRPDPGTWEDQQDYEVDLSQGN